MNRDAFDHAVRASGAILGENEVLVIGSQALHASISSDLPFEAERSVEADIAALDDPDDRKADLIDPPPLPMNDCVQLSCGGVTMLNALAKAMLNGVDLFRIVLRAKPPGIAELDTTAVRTPGPVPGRW